MKRTIVVAAAASLLLFAACGGSPHSANNSPAPRGHPTTLAPAGPSLKNIESGFGGSAQNWEADAIVTNESKFMLAEQVTVQATLCSSSKCGGPGDTVIGTGDEMIPFLHAGQRAVANIPIGGGTPAPASVHIVSSTGVWTSQDPEPYARITGSDIRIGPGGLGYTIHAVISSSYAEDSLNVHVDAVCTNQRGQIDGGASTDLPRVFGGAGSRTSVSIAAPGATPHMCQIDGYPVTMGNKASPPNVTG